MITYNLWILMNVYELPYNGQLGARVLNTFCRFALLIHNYFETSCVF